MEVMQKEFKDNLEKLNSEIFSLKENHKKEILKYKKELQRKNSEVIGELKQIHYARNRP